MSSKGVQGLGDGLGFGLCIVGRSCKRLEFGGCSGWRIRIEGSRGDLCCDLFLLRSLRDWSMWHMNLWSSSVIVFGSINFEGFLKVKRCSTDPRDLLVSVWEVLCMDVEDLVWAIITRCVLWYSVSVSYLTINSVKTKANCPEVTLTELPVFLFAHFTEWQLVISDFQFRHRTIMCFTFWRSRSTVKSMYSRISSWVFDCP